MKDCSDPYHFSPLIFRFQHIQSLTFSKNQSPFSQSGKKNGQPYLVYVLPVLCMVICVVRVARGYRKPRPKLYGSALPHCTQEIPRFPQNPGHPPPLAEPPGTHWGRIGVSVLYLEFFSSLCRNDKKNTLQAVPPPRKVTTIKNLRLRVIETEQLK